MTHLSTAATIGDTVTAAVKAVKASIAILLVMLFRPVDAKVESWSNELADAWRLIAAGIGVFEQDYPFTV